MHSGLFEEGTKPPPVVEARHESISANKIIMLKLFAAESRVHD